MYLAATLLPLPWYSLLWAFANKFVCYYSAFEIASVNSGNKIISTFVSLFSLSKSWHWVTLMPINWVLIFYDSVFNWYGSYRSWMKPTVYRHIVYFLSKMCIVYKKKVTGRNKYCYPRFLTEDNTTQYEEFLYLIVSWRNSKLFNNPEDIRASLTKR